MPVDFHVHLEEGPYTFNWLKSTILSIDEFTKDNNCIGTKNRLIRQINSLNKRLEQGCNHEEWLSLYLEKAKQIGLKEVGIVDHLYRFNETRHYYEKYINIDQNNHIGMLQRNWLTNVRTENLNDFIQCILDAQEKWRKQGIELRLGIEADYFPGGEIELKELLNGHPWDFVIGSTHFINGWGFDNPETIPYYEKWDLEELYTIFYNLVEKMIRTQIFDFVAHLDNLKGFNFKVEDHSFNRMWFERIADALVETGTSTEINAGLYYRYPVKEMCPGPDFLQVLVNKGVSFTLSSDSHFPKDLGNYVFENRDVLKKLGVQEVATFNQRKKIMKRI